MTAPESFTTSATIC